MDRNLQRLLDETLRPDRLPFKLSKEEARIKVMKRISENASSAKVIALDKKSTAGWKIAAGIAVVLTMAAVLTYFLTNVSVQNEKGAPLAYTLPDESTVILQTDAEVTFNSILYGLSRKVNLEGKAFFKVLKGESFNVYSPAGRVEVLGTSFSVDATDQRLEVACKTGKVAVYSINEGAVTLTPGNAVEMKGNSPSLYTVNPASVDAWVKGEYNFENSKTEAVWRSVEEAFGYEVIDRTGEDMTYTGQFSTRQNLRDVLEIICRPLEVSYRINEDSKVIIISQNDNHGS